MVHDALGNPALASALKLQLSGFMGEGLFDVAKTWVNQGCLAACPRQNKRHRSDSWEIQLGQRTWQVRTPAVILNESHG